MNKLAENILHDILNNLNNRGGFDDWGYGVNKDIRDEIETELITSIKGNLKRYESLKLSKSSDT